LRRKILISILFSIATHTFVFGEDTVVLAQNDGVLSVLNDSTLFYEDDSIALAQNDSIAVNDATAPRSRSAIDSRIDYKARDSLFFDMRNNRAYLFEKAQINYKDIELTAGKIVVNFDRQEVSAFPLLDSLGRERDRPVFNDTRQTFQARELTYNFESGKARVKNIVTQEGEMLIHGDLVKKMPNNEAFVKRARFTTCDLEHPHFHIVARRAKIIPDDKVVTGGAMLFLNDVPTPLALPFGLFPNTTRHTTGVLIPTYGESHGQGFFLRDGGFYWGINDYMDWKITGDIFTRGEWRVRNAVQYAKRYKFSGGLNLELGMVPDGERGTDRFSMTRSMRVGWNHAQDPKANQNSTFSANVNFFNSASQKYSSVISDHFNNQSTSNIAYQVRIANRFNISTAANLDYHITSGNISATLPTINLSMNPIFPFQRKVRRGAPKWYESFRINYSMSATNRVSGNDSSFWNQDLLKNMVSGVRHNIPMNMEIKLLRGRINWNHSVNYSEQWHFKAVRRGVDTIFWKDTDSIIGINRNAILEENHGFFATRDYGYSTSFSTQLFGMFQAKRGPIRAFRHVLMPSVGFSYRPDFTTGRIGYYSGYRHFIDTNGNEVHYNRFQGSPFGVPSGRKSGSITFNVNNNFEMKVRNRKDTITGMRKVKLIDRLNLSTSYNLAADSLNWAPINLTAQTTIFRNLSINYNAVFELYARDTNNRVYNKFIWQTGDKLLLRVSENMSTGLNWSFKSKNSNDKNKTSRRVSENTEIFRQTAMFEPQWALNIGYTIGYSSRFDPRRRPQTTNIWGHPAREPFYSDYNRRIMQTLTFSGNLNPTKNWNITFNSGFDFIEKRISQTMFNISRDLHCWAMTFTWAPFGHFKEWSFNIRLRSSMLGDAMKYDRRSSIREMDNYH